MAIIDTTAPNVLSYDVTDISIQEMQKFVIQHVNARLDQAMMMVLQPPESTPTPPTEVFVVIRVTKATEDLPVIQNQTEFEEPDASP